jgi:hypothetical protein
MDHRVLEYDALWPGCQHSQSSSFPPAKLPLSGPFGDCGDSLYKDIPYVGDMHGGGLKRRKTKHVEGKYDVTIESIVDDSSRLHDYGFSRATWLRGARLMQHLGSDQALEQMDGRADRALARGDLKICHKWRDLMGVIHAIESEEPQPTDRIH